MAPMAISSCRNTRYIVWRMDGMLVIHGHELDTVVQNVKWLAFAGDAALNASLTSSSRELTVASP